MTQPLPDDEPDLYAVLGVDRQAPAQALKQAYRKLALALHPDKTQDPGASARFKQVTRAYNVLADDAKRRYYDAHGTLEDIDVSAEEWMQQFAEVMQELTGGLTVKARLQVYSTMHNHAETSCENPTFQCWWHLSVHIGTKIGAQLHAQRHDLQQAQSIFATVS
jgi:DnaJ-class molecular chaperone